MEVSISCLTSLLLVIVYLFLDLFFCDILRLFILSFLAKEQIVGWSKGRNLMFSSHYLVWKEQIFTGIWANWPVLYDMVPC